MKLFILTCALFLQTAQCTGGEVLGRGGSSCVQQLKSPIYPGAVIKLGRQKDLQIEADMMARMRHPGIVRVFAVLRDEGTQVSPNAAGYMVMERMGPNIFGQMGRSAHIARLVILT